MIERFQPVDDVYFFLAAFLSKNFFGFFFSFRLLSVDAIALHCIAYGIDRTSKYNIPIDSQDVYSSAERTHAKVEKQKFALSTP